MRNNWQTLKGLALFFILSLLCLKQVFAQSVARSGFDKLPSKFFYFKDSEVILWFDSNSHLLYRSENQGKDWNKIQDVSNEVEFLYEHPYDNNRAYVLTPGKIHWKTTDKGKTWQQFQTRIEAGGSPPHLSFHAERSGYILFHGTSCKLGSWTGMECQSTYLYTFDNFDSAQMLREHATSCIWSLSSSKFRNAPTNDIMCVEPTSDSKDYHLVRSDTFFQTEKVVDFGEGKPINGVIDVSAVGPFIVAAANPDKKVTDMSLYVTLDGQIWHEAVFPEGASLQEKSFTIIESSNPSLLIDVLEGERSRYGSLYKSNSNGTFFTKSLENTNRNPTGFIDVERIPGMEGVLMANEIINARQVETQMAEHLVRTRISFDDGGSWKEITTVRDTHGNHMGCRNGKCTLNLHSVTSNHNIGQIASSQTAVGVLMGVGNYGPYLMSYDECDTFLSTDGGISWNMVREGAHMYEFGDMGTLIVMVDDEKDTDHVLWSKDRGAHWEQLNLGMTVRARALTTDPESTSRKFLLIAGSARFAEANVQAIQLDFSSIYNRQCRLDPDESRSDFEKWFARDITEGPDCLMGHEQMFYRRKAQSDCYVGREFQDPETETKNCACTKFDYECDYNFLRNSNGDCTRVGPDRIPSSECRSKDDTYYGSSGYRLVPGNTCIPPNYNRLDEPVKRRCGDNTSGVVPSVSGNAYLPADKGIQQYQIKFRSEIEQFLYFKKSEYVLVRLQSGEVWRAENQGMSWKRVLENDGYVSSLVMHEFNEKRAYAILKDGLRYTEDQGATWSSIKTPAPPTISSPDVLDFHPVQKDWLLFIGDAQDSLAHNEAYVSRNHGGDWTALDMHVGKCIFGRDAHFQVEEDTVFCSAYDKNQPESDLSLVRVNFLKDTTNVYFEKIVEFFVIEDFMAVASTDKGELTLHTSIDGKNFAEAQFPPNEYVSRMTFTVLQSTTHSVLLNIFKNMGSGRAVGTLYKSNENGTFYHMSLDNTNGASSGFVDFEKFQSIDGIILANQVWNTVDLIGHPEKSKQVRTMISWDDGGSWHPLSPPNNMNCDTKDCTLNLHSRSDIQGVGAIFSSVGAPGLAMGVGNVGPFMKEYSESDTFMTRDGGHTWIKIRDGEHLYEFGDQGSILALINDEGPTNEMSYSWDQGANWHTYAFSSEPIRVKTLTTDPNSSTLRFVIIGHLRSGERSPVVTTVDFSQANQPKCVINKNDESRSDFERWVPKDEDNDDACLLGKKTAYWRRKKDRQCKVDAQVYEPEVILENCECRETDFECDFGFWRLDEKCVSAGVHPDRPARCEAGDKFTGRSGYKKISKSTCTGGIDLSKSIQMDCGDRGDVISSRFEFTDRVMDYIYFSDTDRVIVRTMDGKIWLSSNDGFSWKELFPNHRIISMYQNPHYDRFVYFITEGTTHFMTSDKGGNFGEIRVPVGPLMNLQGAVMNFHNDDSRYLIYIGEKDCDSGFGSSCHSEAFYSHDAGKNWARIATYVRGCIWGREGKIKETDRDSIFCEQYGQQSGNQMSLFGSPLHLISSRDYFHNKKVVKENIVGVTVFGKYMVVAASKQSGTGLQLIVSIDGQTFAPASFPANADLSPEAFTIMESANSLWIHVTTNPTRGGEYGSILTSNSNGTYYVDSLKYANRNSEGIVDFEKMQGIEGIALANVVTNSNQANRGDRKMLSTHITVDAGAHWNPIKAPDADSKGRAYECEKCQLNLHCYSERKNTRDLFSLSSAVGLMIGVGNVGDHLTDYRNGDMFLTRDAGKTWSEIGKGAHIWEFADQGSLLILADSEQPTHVVKYTMDEGLTWNIYEFANRGSGMIVEDIITQPDGTSQKYVLFGTRNGKTMAIHIDFSPVRRNKCLLDLSNPNNDDFELWSPEDTRGEKCLFGRETSYYRRIRDHDCYIGEKLIQPREEIRNCACTEEDFECDYNYVRNSDNTCVLVPGLKPLQPSCDGTIDYYYEPSGYRIIAASTCEGGEEFSRLGKKVMCPGRKQPGGGSGNGWIAFIILPIVGAIALFVVLQLRKRGSFRGRIRLPENGTQTRSKLLSNPILAKVVASVFVVPVAIIGILSHIPFPRSISEVTEMLGNIRFPPLFSRNRRNGDYSALGQDEQAGVLLQDYDGSEEHLLGDDELDDADEF
ncbi:hypothetical protein BY458DRAFT_499521 [Sporodiniella umbellata]|nr:hypothetical protein BY458DRAFT_499521 [Sporodiniella umbellata]